MNHPFLRQTNRPTPPPSPLPRLLSNPVLHDRSSVHFSSAPVTIQLNQIYDVHQSIEVHNNFHVPIYLDVDEAPSQISGVFFARSISASVKKRKEEIMKGEKPMASQPPIFGWSIYLVQHQYIKDAIIGIAVRGFLGNILDLFHGSTDSAAFMSQVGSMAASVRGPHFVF
jgi:hypothetical protein